MGEVYGLSRQHLIEFRHFYVDVSEMIVLLENLSSSTMLVAGGALDDISKNEVDVC